LVSATRSYRNIAGDHLNQNLHHAQGQHPGQAQTRESGDLPSKTVTTGRGAPEGVFDGR
jgi:hypothetical protein